MEVCKGILVSKLNINLSDEDTGEQYIKSDSINIEQLRGLSGYRIYWLGMESSGGFCVNTINVFDSSSIDNALNVEIQTDTPKIRSFILNFVSNFFNLVMNPTHNSILLYAKEPSLAKNKQLKKKGLIPVPKVYTIMPVGELKEYIDWFREGELNNPRFDYSHKFWVRGHWRQLKDDRYKTKGKIFIYPFIKGKGLLVKKIRISKESKKVEEMEMKK